MGGEWRKKKIEEQMQDTDKPFMSLLTPSWLLQKPV